METKLQSTNREYFTIYDISKSVMYLHETSYSTVIYSKQN